MKHDEIITLNRNKLKTELKHEDCINNYSYTNKLISYTFNLEQTSKIFDLNIDK